MRTHYVPIWAPKQGMLRDRALCGLYVLPSQEDCLHPTCPQCQQLIAEDEAHRIAERNIAALLQAFDRG